MAAKKTYRHAKTGEVGEYAPELARNFPDLIETDSEVICLPCQAAKAEKAAEQEATIIEEDQA